MIVKKRTGQAQFVAVALSAQPALMRCAANDRCEPEETYTMFAQLIGFSLFRTRDDIDGIRVNYVAAKDMTLQSVCDIGDKRLFFVIRKAVKSACNWHRTEMKWNELCGNGDHDGQLLSNNRYILKPSTRNILNQRVR